MSPSVHDRWRGARSAKYQITVAKLPFAREIEEFTFDGTPINETLVRDLARGEFLNQQRNVVLVGGTGTGKTHISVAIARALNRHCGKNRWRSLRCSGRGGSASQSVPKNFSGQRRLAEVDRILASH